MEKQKITLTAHSIEELRDILSKIGNNVIVDIIIDDAKEGGNEIRNRSR